MSNLLALALAAAQPAAAGPVPAPQVESSPSREIVGARLQFVARGEAAPVPFEIPRGHIVFRANVAGRDIWALLDNGSDASLVDSAFALEAGLELDGTRGTARTLSGVMEAARARDVPFQVPGQFRIVAPRLVVVDLGPISRIEGRRIDAFLGGDILHQMTLQVDPAAGTFQFGPPGAFRAPASLPFVPLLGGGPLFELRSNGRTLRVKIDLGSNTVLSLTPEAWARVAPEGAGTSALQTVDAQGGRELARRGTLAEAVIGARTYRNLPVTVRPMPTIEADGMVGMGFLRAFTFVMDVREGKLWLVPRRRSAPPAERTPEAPAEPTEENP